MQMNVYKIHTLYIYYLTTIDGIILHFSHKNKYLFQIFNIPYSSAGMFW